MNNQTQPLSEDYYKDEWMKNLKVTQELREELFKKEQAIQKTLKELKNKDFIMSILNDEVSVDEIEGMKFICIEGVREKIDTTFKKHFGGFAE